MSPTTIPDALFVVPWNCFYRNRVKIFTIKGDIYGLLLESSKCEPKFYGVARASADTNSPFTTNWEVSEYAGSNLVYEKTPDLAKRIS